MTKDNARRTAAPVGGAPWRLQDAKACFSELVRRARQDGPQRVTLHGQDAVVVISAEEYDKGRAERTGRRLVEALAASPLRGIELEIERPGPGGPVRPVEL